MADNPRIDDLRRRIQKDPASIAFAQLAEECRRAGEYQEAVDTCRAGLTLHPGYLSARVTLGRALVELGRLDEGQVELARVLESAPENLAAIRGLAEIYHRRGDLAQALAQYRAALQLARNDPDLEETIADLARNIEPAKPVESGGLSLQHMHQELMKHASSKAAVAPATPMAEDRAAVTVSGDEGPSAGAEEMPPSPPERPVDFDLPLTQPADPSASAAEPSAPAMAGAMAVISEAPAHDERAVRTIEALEQWLQAIHVARAARST
jgi:tetratricopeptide (TPR) repeat protein